MLLFTKLQTLFGVHQFSTVVLFLFQNPVLATRLHLSCCVSPLMYDGFSEYTSAEYFLHPDVCMELLLSLS